jgi:DNA-binding NarL/FixJ family response regulator
MPLKVLIADDSPQVAEMLTELIADPGHVDVIGIAETQAAAIEAIRTLRPDVAVLDLQLKTGSGTDVLRAVRSEPSLASVLLLVTSNHVSPLLRAACLELGADGYYDKVKELGALTERIAQIATTRR